MALDTQELSYFATLAEQLHFGRAASRLHISQPALSKRIKSLEEKVGGPLLVRNRRGVALTMAGTIFYKEARRITRDLEVAFDLVRGATSGELGRLRLGVGMSTIHGLVPRALLKFRASSPGVEIEIADMATLKQIEALTSGRLDVGFVRLPVKHPLLAVRKVITERLTIATSDKFNGPMTMKGIKDQSFILIDRGVSATYHDHCISLCDRSGFTPRIVYEPNDMFTILNLVSAGIGVSLVPRAARAMQVNGVKFAPVLSSFAEWDIGMAWNKQLESELIRKFADACRPG
jgi:DNA-binding transcriptional LysR family regulator